MEILKLNICVISLSVDMLNSLIKIDTAKRRLTTFYLLYSKVYGNITMSQHHLEPGRNEKSQILPQTL
jgi:hypothetical protein